MHNMFPQSKIIVSKTCFWEKREFSL